MGHPSCRTKGSGRRFRFRIIAICRLINKFSVPTSRKLVDVLRALSGCRPSSHLVKGRKLDTGIGREQVQDMHERTPRSGWLRICSMNPTIYRLTSLLHTSIWFVLVLPPVTVSFLSTVIPIPEPFSDRLARSAAKHKTYQGQNCQRRTHEYVPIAENKLKDDDFGGSPASRDPDLTAFPCSPLTKVAGYIDGASHHAAVMFAHWLHHLRCSCPQPLQP